VPSPEMAQAPGRGRPMALEADAPGARGPRAARGRSRQRQDREGALHQPPYGSDPRTEPDREAGRPLPPRGGDVLDAEWDAQGPRARRQVGAWRDPALEHAPPRAGETSPPGTTRMVRSP